MMENNKAILEQANAAIVKGDYEGFLSHCTEDTEWVFVGERTLQGKEAVRQYMAEVYLEPPVFMVEKLVAGEDHVTAIGKINLKDDSGAAASYTYCDVWRFQAGKMAGLQAFVIKD
ncbi:ketosteroid isomerase [Cnuella takakiae]|nr:ketosteroid isomerase [Cnuella takakiae]